MISDSHRASLQRAGVVAVWIEDPLTDGIEPLEVLGDETKRRATAAIHDAFTTVAASLPHRDPLSVEAVKEMSEVAEWIIRDITRNIESALALNDLANADGYTLQHSLNVTTLGVALGLRVMHKFGWVDAGSTTSGSTSAFSAIGSSVASFAGTSTGASVATSSAKAIRIWSGVSLELVMLMSPLVTASICLAYCGNCDTTKRRKRQRRGVSYTYKAGITPALHPDDLRGAAL